MHCTEGSSTEFEATGPCGNTMSYLLQCIMAREPDSLARVCVLHVALQVRTEVFALYDRYTTYFRVQFCGRGRFFERITNRDFGKNIIVH